ncbi:MAG: hypothetical protein QOD32_803 [Pyrinomonadaceae bacterium]|jgi:hypothetical protein|nr:hypothetical protein [Pyrinomonadaceae bacterium]
MPDENAPQQPDPVPDNAITEAKVPEMQVSTRSRLWWAILAVYLALFIGTGYIAFFNRDTNPALNRSADTYAISITDESSKAFIIDVLKDEAAEHKKKEALGQQSFNIVLGSLLGFLSASAVSHIGASSGGNKE